MTTRDGSVRALSLEVPDGDAVALVATRRAELTPLLRAIAGFEALAAGAVELGGRVVDAVPVERRGIGLVVAGGALYPRLDVAANLRFGPSLRGLPAAEVQRLVAELSAECGIEHLLAARPSALTPEETVRVALARSLARGPAALLFDDAFAGVDVPGRLRLATLVQRVQAARGLTTLLATTHGTEALALARRVAVVAGGVLLQEASAAEVYDRPASRAVAAMFGALPMNLVERPVVDGLVRLGGRDWPVPGAAASVVVGVRPEQLSLEAHDGTIALAGRVVSRTPAGSDVLLGVDVGGAVLVARVGPDRVPAEGADAPLHVDPTRLRFFATDAAGREIPWLPESPVPAPPARPDASDAAA